MKKTIVCLTLIFVLALTCSCTPQKAKETIKFDKKDSLVIAHRGLSGIEVENTAAAFIEAGKRTYFGIEADVKRTSDGKFVICHDDDLGKLCGDKIPVESSTLAQLLEFELFNKYGNKNKAEHLIYLETYISICKEYGACAVLEFKSDFNKEEIIEIINIIKNLEYLNGVIFISFDYNQLLTVREILPTQPVMYLAHTVSEDAVLRLLWDRVDLSIGHAALTQDLLDRFHSAGLKVSVWTVNDKAKAERLADMGVDYITTDILE